ncbi:oxysterol-binding protein 1-like isoform X3 [Bolinopsis microptera]|uniref:oxysterol-binding protein 1-like isoform X3 n=1 Tax=Bolinopsis microptera TaxID=2820187 RepID=UPI00307B0694
MAPVSLNSSWRAVSKKKKRSNNNDEERMSSSGEATGSDSSEYRGWLLKWTNYIKGYRQRWFVLSDGLLSYYRSQAEMAHTCRGTINLAGASLESEDSCNFVISNGGAQVFHLRARSEVDRQRWITALELAKDRANKMRERVDDEEDFVVSPETTATALRQKLDHLNTCQNLVNQHGLALQQAISQIEDSAKLKSLMKDPVIAHLIKKTAEFRVASSSMIKACSTFVTYAAHHEKEWQMAREQRERLEETVESLARQHMSLEKAMTKSKRNLSDIKQDRPPGEGVVGIFDSDEEDEDFYDAMDNSEANNGNVAAVAAAPKVEPPTAVAPLDTGKSTLSTRTTSRKRRLRIPDKPNDKANLWNIMKNCIGKELSKIPMPVNFNEPISFLQRLTEDMEYGDLLTRAAECATVEESLTYLSAIAVSSYATTSCRTSKPFNPLLGETFEYDRTDDMGWRSFAEQVSHHPPVSALHVEHDNWIYYQDFSMTSKFRGKYLQVFPIGTTHFIVKSTGHHYTWNKVCTTVHNIIVGKLWVDQSGEILVKEHKTGASARVKFHPYSYFSRETPRRVTGSVLSPDGSPKFELQGTWDSSMSCAEVLSSEGDNWDTAEHQTRWVKNTPLEDSDKIYNFTAMAVTLNEPDEEVAPTDARRRPDQRLMEEQKFPAANNMKLTLEEAQRTRRRAREAKIAAEGPSAKYVPKWFAKRECEITGEEIWRFTDEYWQCKQSQTWDRCPSLYMDDEQEEDAT